MKTPVKVIGSIVGALFVLVGAVWTLQGSNILTQGVMAGHPRWIVLGLLLAAVGIVVIVLVNARRKSSA